MIKRVILGSEGKHTPTPWKVEGSVWGGGEIISPNVLVLADDGACNDDDCCPSGPTSKVYFPNEMDAAFIVKACNAYEELFEAAKAVAENRCYEHSPSAMERLKTIVAKSKLR